MGLLEKLWDETVAGPAPEKGLGRLRKFPPTSIRTDFTKDEEARNMTGSESSAAAETTPRITRSIMIRRPAGSPGGNGSTPPESPAETSTPPISPFTGKTEWNRLRRKSMSDAYSRSSGSSSSSIAGVGSVHATQEGSAVEILGIGSRNQCPPLTSDSNHQLPTLSSLHSGAT